MNPVEKKVSVLLLAAMLLVAIIITHGVIAWKTAAPPQPRPQSTGGWGPSPFRDIDTIVPF